MDLLRVLFFPLWMGTGVVAGFHVAQAGLTLSVAETDSELPQPTFQACRGRAQSCYSASADWSACLHKSQTGPVNLRPLVRTTFQHNKFPLECCVLVYISENTI